MNMQQQNFAAASIDNSLDQHDLWEQELDLIGAAASNDQLQEMLNRAPDPMSATAQLLMGYLAGQQIPSQMMVA